MLALDSPNEVTMSAENSLILAKLLQHVSSVTKKSLHSDIKKMGKNVD